MPQSPDLPDKDQAPEADTPPGQPTMAEIILKAAEVFVAGNSEAETTLNKAIVYCLMSDNDADITQAIELAPTLKAVDAIKASVRLAAMNAFNVELPGVEGSLNVELFAIPVMLALPGSKYQEAPRALTSEDIDWLAQSFIPHGLQDPDHELMLIAPQLWSASELYNLPYTRVFKLVHAFGEAMTSKTVIDPKEIMGINVAPLEIPPGHTHLCLRYMIGAWAHPLKNPLPFLKQENEEKLDTWRDAAGDRLGKTFGCPVEVFIPDAFYPAIENGWFHHHAFKVALEQAHLFRKSRVLPAEIVAVISLHATETAPTQIRIGYTRFLEDGEPELIGGSIWKLAPFDDPIVIAEFLKKAMESNGIRAVEIAGEPQRDDSGDGDGTPTFLRPTISATPDQVAPLPASKHMH